jgi:energy-coupling factor transporter transmembrane protein EcfT
VKLIWLLSFAAVYFTENELLIFVMTISSAAMFLSSGAHKTVYMEAFYYILIFLIVLFILATWGSGGEANIVSSLTVISKWLTITLSSIAFFVMTRPFELMGAMRSFRVPEGFVFSLGIGFRFIPIIIESTDKILMAQKARGLYSGKGFKKVLSIPTMINAITIPLIVEMLNRLWDMWLALMVRGFDISKRRKNAKLKLSASNLCILIYSFAVIAICATEILLRSSSL